jgi:hypothetical protein
MAKPRRTRTTSEPAAGSTIRLEVARSATLRLTVRQTKKTDKLRNVTVRLSASEYRRLILWQFLHRDCVNSIQTACRHLLARVLPDELVVCRRKVVEAPAVEQTPADDELEPLPVGTLRAVPPPIPEGEPAVTFKFGMLDTEHTTLTLWGLEHAGCLGSTELGPACRHLLLLSLEGEDLVVCRRKVKEPPVTGTPAYTPEGLAVIRSALGLAPTPPMPTAA